MNLSVIAGILLPFFGTALGAAMVFFLKNSISKNLQHVLTGFAAGVMVAASFWSLLQPALEGSADMGRLSFLPAAVGFLAGMGFLLLLDEVTPHMHMDQEEEGPKTALQRTTKLILAVTLHNIPEGMAVGVVYADLVSGNGFVSAAGALALAIGIAIQNFPEGAIVSMPLRAEGMPKKTTFPPPVPARVCRGGNVLCCRGGTDTRDVGRGAFEPGDHSVQLRLCADDDTGCGIRVNAGVAE